MVAVITCISQDLSFLATASCKVPETLLGSTSRAHTCAHRQAPLATAVKFPFNWASPSPINTTALFRPKSPLNHRHFLPGMLLLPIIHCLHLAWGLPAPSWETGWTCGSTSTAQWQYIVLNKGLQAWILFFVSL